MRMKELAALLEDLAKERIKQGAKRRRMKTNIRLPRKLPWSDKGWIFVDTETCEMWAY